MKQSLAIMFFLISIRLSACLCSYDSFCYLNNQDLQAVIVEVTCIEQIKHPFFGDGVFLKVDRVFRDDDNIVTDTIKIMGRVTTQCDVDVHQFFPEGERRIVFMATKDNSNGQEVGLPFINPDAPIENYWDFAPNICYFYSLNIEDDIVRGIIAPEVYAYPYDQFVEHLKDCSYEQIVYDDLNCEMDAITVSPNPSPDGMFELNGNYTYINTMTIDVLNISGHLIQTIDRDWRTFHIDEPGLYILRIRCGSNVHFKRILVGI